MTTLRRYVNILLIPVLIFSSFIEVEAKSGYLIKHVSLSSFTVESIHNTVQIKWRTESEFQNLVWIIQRKDGRGRYKTISIFDGQITKSVATDYEYIDTDVKIGDQYTYRLLDISTKNDTVFHDEKNLMIDLPDKFDLSPNYPNPFNPNTQITYKLPVDAEITIKIFNILGQEVITLLDKRQKAGYHEISWHGKDKRGYRVASGLYVYQMFANGKNGENYLQTRRMILAK